MVWAPYIRPGFALSKQIGLLLRAHPEATCVIMSKHGLITWGDDARRSYHSAIVHIQRAEDALREAEKRVFGLAQVNEALEKLTVSVTRHTREAIAAAVMPTLCGAVTAQHKAIIIFDDSEDVLRFLTRKDAKELSQVGAACPDHLVHTKRVPLFVEWDGKDVERLKAALKEGLGRYIAEYTD